MAIIAQQLLSGTVGRVYELRTVGKDNTAVIDFSVAMTPRKRVGDEWVDGETYWVTVTAWNRLAKNIAESFKSGDRVLIWGRTDMKAGYTNKDGEEVPPRPIVIADAAGLSVDIRPAHSERSDKGEDSGNHYRHNSSASEKTSSAKATPQASKRDEIDDDLDDDGDYDEFTPF